jgi:hypothetical protein
MDRVDNHRRLKLGVEGCSLCEDIYRHQFLWPGVAFEGDSKKLSSSGSATVCSNQVLPMEQMSSSITSSRSSYHSVSAVVEADQFPIEMDID